jgi:6-phosphofructokinase
VRDIHLKGGSILGTARTNPTKSEEHMKNLFTVFHKLGITALVTIGGDDTAFSASVVRKRSNGEIKVAHVPKTIDNDLPLPGNRADVRLRNRAALRRADCPQSDGRRAHHFALVSHHQHGPRGGTSRAGHRQGGGGDTLHHPEEFRDRQVTVDEVCDIIIGSIIKRRAEGSRYGLVVLAEGLIEAHG